MPNRLIREGLLDSERVADLADRAERLFVRMLVAADDAGRLDGRPRILSARTAPFLAIPEKAMGQILDEIESAGLIKRYSVDGKPFIQVMRWQKCGKAQMSKFPWENGSFEIRYAPRQTRDGEKDFVITSLSPHPDGVITPSGPHADGVTVDSEETNTETETETNTKTGSRTGSDRKLPFPSSSFEKVWMEWERYRKEKRNSLTKSTRTKQLAKLGKLTEPVAIATIERSIENGWTGLFPDKVNEKTQKPTGPPQWLPKNWHEIAREVTGEDCSELSWPEFVAKHRDHQADVEEACREATRKGGARHE